VWLVAADEGHVFQVGPVRWAGAGSEYARATVVYVNKTARTYARVSIQCIGRAVDDMPVSDFSKLYSVPDLIRPGDEKVFEAVLSNGRLVKSVTCQVDRTRVY